MIVAMPGESMTFVYGILALLWVLLALQTALAMRRLNRRWWVWLLVSLLASAIPAAIVAVADQVRRLQAQRRGQRQSAARCPHCGASLGAGRRHRVAGRMECPSCKMLLDDSRYA